MLIVFAVGKKLRIIKPPTAGLFTGVALPPGGCKKGTVGLLTGLLLGPTGVAVDVAVAAMMKGVAVDGIDVAVAMITWVGVTGTMPV